MYSKYTKILFVLSSTSNLTYIQLSSHVDSLCFFIFVLKKKKEKQISEYSFHQNINFIEECAKVDLRAHRDAIQERRRVDEARKSNTTGDDEEGMERGEDGGENARSGNNGTTTRRRRRRQEEEGGIDFYLGGAAALPCLYNNDVLRQEKEKRRVVELDSEKKGLTPPKKKSPPIEQCKCSENFVLITINYLYYSESYIY